MFNQVCITLQIIPKSKGETTAEASLVCAPSWLDHFGSVWLVGLPVPLMLQAGFRVWLMLPCYEQTERVVPPVQTCISAAVRKPVCL